MNARIKKLYDNEGNETGAILCFEFGAPTNIQQKSIIENKLIQYAFDTLYPGEGLNIYRDIYFDTPSITVIRSVDNLPSNQITI